MAKEFKYADKASQEMIRRAAKENIDTVWDRLSEQIADFETEFGSSDCRDLINYQISIPVEHDAFIASNVWRTTCMRQIEFLTFVPGTVKRWLL